MGTYRDHERFVVVGLAEPFDVWWVWSACRLQTLVFLWPAELRPRGCEDIVYKYGEVMTTSMIRLMMVMDDDDEF